MQTVIEAKDVKKNYDTQTAVNGISFKVHQGEIFGIVGPNGAGKTTLIEIIEGLRKADSGTVKVLGKDIHHHAKEIKQRIGVLLQATSIPERAKVKEIFELFASLYHTSVDLQQLNEFLDLQDKQNATIKSLSGGWKQRVSLALALINDPDIVFLDEPSMGLDPSARHQMWDKILKLKQEGRTIIVTTHYMEEAETLCDRIAFIHHGKLIALDTPERLIDQLSSRTKRVSFRRLPQLDQASIEAIPHATNITWEIRWVKFDTNHPDISLKHLFQLAEQENWLVSDLKLEDASMNDVFNELMDIGKDDRS